jgi:stage V sporulation protein G
VQITEVRIKLMEDSDDRLQAFCSITFDDCFVVRDLKIIEGSSGPFVAMPSRKLTAHCPECGCKNHLRAGFCNQCGEKLRDDRAARDSEGRCKLYADIAHPINSICREMIQERVITEYRGEIERSQQPGYVSRYDDDYGLDEGPDAEFDEATAARREAPAPRPAQRAHVQPAEREPRPPHQPVALGHSRSAARETSGSTRSDDSSAPPAPPRRGNEGFGAGIF